MNCQDRPSKNARAHVRANDDWDSAPVPTHQVPGPGRSGNHHGNDEARHLAWRTQTARRDVLGDSNRGVDHNFRLVRPRDPERKTAQRPS